LSSGLSRGPAFYQRQIWSAEQRTCFVRSFCGALAGGVIEDVIGPPTDLEGGLFSEINDNSVAILLTHGTARILLAGDAEANEEEYMANGPYTGPLTMCKRLANLEVSRT